MVAMLVIFVEQLNIFKQYLQLWSYNSQSTDKYTVYIYCHIQIPM